MRACILALALATSTSGCGRGGFDGTPANGDAMAVHDGPDQTNDASSCAAPALPLSEQTVFGPLFANDYRMYVLGNPVAPDTVVIHGLTVMPDDPDHLLLALTGGIYAVAVARDTCHHISGFTGAPTLIVETGSTIAGFGALAPGPNNLLFASYSFATDSTEHGLGLAEAEAGQLDPIYSTDLGLMGITGNDFASMALVPAGLPGAGGLRVIDGAGALYHVNYAADQSWFAISGATGPLTFPSSPYGYNYVPSGSPDFAQPSVLVANGGAIDAYALDGTGDPILSTSVPFVSQLGFSTGSCCEAMRAQTTDPTTGDVIYAGLPAGELYLTRGFAPLLLL